MRISTEYSPTLPSPRHGSAQPPRFHSAQASGSGSGVWPGVPPAVADQSQVDEDCQDPSTGAD
eukprot:14378827-Alexandrium_andersonii.AAC.1